MRRHGLGPTSSNLKSHPTWSARAAVLAVVVLVGIIAAACNSSPSASTSTTSTTAVANFSTLITEGQAAQNAGDSSQAESFYDQALALQPNNSIALYDLADLQQVALNDPAAAKANYEKAIANSPNFENALFNLAIIVTSTDPTQAEGYYNRVLKIDPKNAAAHLNLGYVLIQLGQKAAGDAQIREAAKLDPVYDNRLPTTTGPTSTSSGTSTT